MGDIICPNSVRTQARQPPTAVLCSYRDTGRQGVLPWVTDEGVEAQRGKAGPRMSSRE